jgi:hypothetical protein
MIARAWRRDRVLDECPIRHHGTLREFAWRALRLHDSVPVIRTWPPADVMACATVQDCVRSLDGAQHEGLPADYRVDCDPRAILGIEWVAAPPPAAREDAGQASLTRHIGP